jgi:uncharacterized protein YndB with AHSA1/START domain
MTILIVIIAICLILIGLNVLMGNVMKIENKVNVNKSDAQVFDFLKLVKNQDLFSVWNMADPNMSKTYKGTDGEVGFVYGWKSDTNKNVGQGEQEITKITPLNRIDFALRFEKPMKNTAASYFEIKKINENSTDVTWTFEGPSKFPMNLFMPIFKKMLAKDMTQSLENLKVYLEK